MRCAESKGPAGADHAPRTRPKSGVGARGARHRSREFALQGLYGWLLGGGDSAAITSQLKSAPAYEQADEPYFLELMQGTTGSADALRAQFVDALDRPLADLSPIEHSILLIATYELTCRPEIPYRVVINEAVELAKDFGGSEGFRYVNGVLDKLAARIRAKVPPESTDTDHRL
jgi:transcription antitermination protein NusB